MKKSSLAMVPMKGISIWVCGSMPPGITSMPPASTISVPVGSLQVRVDRDDHAIFAQHVGTDGLLGGYDRPASDQQLHANLLPLMFPGRRCP